MENTNLFYEISKLKEGWDLFESFEYGIQIERIDDEMKFNSDVEAIKFVVEKAMAGSKIHKDTLAYLAQKASDDECRFMIKALASKTKRDIVLQQIDAIENLQRLGHNIVSCHSCGSILIVKSGLKAEPVDCFCGKSVHPYDCEDLYYRGIENNAEFQ